MSLVVTVINNPGNEKTLLALFARLLPGWLVSAVQRVSTRLTFQGPMGMVFIGLV